MQVIKSICLGILLYGILSVYAWLEYKMLFSFLLASVLIIFFSIIIFVICKRDEQELENFELELGTRQVEIENRRVDAEQFIVNSGNEEAFRLLEKARENPHSYIRILSEGLDKDNETISIALGIIAGMFDEIVPAEVDTKSVVKALERMESKLIGKNFPAESN